VRPDDQVVGTMLDGDEERAEWDNCSAVTDQL